jgi:hypothetical protein
MSLPSPRLIHGIDPQPIVLQYFASKPEAIERGLQPSLFGFTA